MLHIYIARHGQDQDNANGILNGRRDEPLTEKGIGQAKILASKIKEVGITFTTIYCSPLQRATKTAEIIAETLDLAKPEKLDKLIERDFGVMTGKAQVKIKEMCEPNILQSDTVTYFLNPHGAETFPQLLERASKLLDELRQKHADGTILLVTHGDFGKMLYASAYNLDWKEVLTLFHFGNSELLHLTAESLESHSPLLRVEQDNL